MTESPNLDRSGALRAALMSDDDLIAVVRGHLYIEASLNRLLDSLVPYPEELENTRLGWPQRVELALALGLEQRYGPPLRKIGQIRNKFAHRPDATLEASDAADLFNTLGEEERSIALESFARTQAQVDDPFEGGFKDLKPKDQFTLLMVAIYEILEIAADEAANQISGT